MLNITVNDIFQLSPNANRSLVLQLVPALNRWLPQYGINTKLRVAHFLAQACHESAQFRTTVEYASGAAYEGRKDLGNIYKGDGKRYKGRGIFQLTGRSNYTAYGALIGVDLVNNPELAANVEISVRVACIYWQKKGLNGWADRNDIGEITRKINGGTNGIADRTALFARAMKINFTDELPNIISTPLPTRSPSMIPGLPVKEELPEAPAVAPTQPEAMFEPIPDAPIAAEPSVPWYRSTEQVTGAAMAGTGLLGAVKDFVQSGWGFATLVFIVMAAGGVYWVYRRRQREKLERPTI